MDKDWELGRELGLRSCSECRLELGWLIWVGNWVWKFGIRIGMVRRMGTGGRIRFMLGIGSRGYGLGLKL